ncbi:MAG: RNA methyltransferase [Anaerostipes sp.]|nr:RNA methyltransferase [Anaerostipes sp.]
MITTVQNKQIKQIKKIEKSARERRKSGQFVVEGIRMFEEIPTSLYQKTFVTEHFYEAHKDLINGDYDIVSDEVMKDMSDTQTPQGVLSLVRCPAYTLEDVISQKEQNLLFLENLQDPGNLGTILRTGEGAGIGGIIMTKETVDIFNPKVIRSTMGSIFRVPFVYIEDTMEVVKRLKEEKITLYAAHLDGVDFTKEPFETQSCFLIGNEGNGLTDELSKNADKLIRIPMDGKVESLNAAMASGLLMYEARRQRKER